MLSIQRTNLLKIQPQSYGLAFNQLLQHSRHFHRICVATNLGRMNK
uniref:Uncharacterized protein n=1 Tax=Rhizophora mucronata TaxID=61149 RepID=A0A2P2LT91_RHIMU